MGRKWGTAKCNASFKLQLSPLPDEEEEEESNLKLVLSTASCNCQAVSSFTGRPICALTAIICLHPVPMDETMFAPTMYVQNFLLVWRFINSIEKAKIPQIGVRNEGDQLIMYYELCI